MHGILRWLGMDQAAKSEAAHVQMALWVILMEF
jgi:hypothetical protein